MFLKKSLFGCVKIKKGCHTASSCSWKQNSPSVKCKMWHDIFKLASSYSKVYVFSEDTFNEALTEQGSLQLTEKWNV